MAAAKTTDLPLSSGHGVMAKSITVPSQPVEINNDADFFDFIDRFSNNYACSYNPAKRTHYIATAVSPQLMAQTSYKVPSGVMNPEAQARFKRPTDGFLIRTAPNMFRLVSVNDVKHLFIKFSNVGSHVSAAEVKQKDMAMDAFVQSLTTKHPSEDKNYLFSNMDSFTSYANTNKLKLFTAKYIDVAESFCSFLDSIDLLVEADDQAQQTVRSRAIVLTPGVVSQQSLYYASEPGARPTFIDSPGVLVCMQTLPQGTCHFQFVAGKPKVVDPTHGVMRAGNWIIKPIVASPTK